MKKEITQEEKIQFYKFFNEEETQKELLKIDEDTFKISFFSSMIGFGIAILSIAFSSWLFFLVLPIFAVTSTALAKRHTRKKELIENLTENITYRDYKKIRKYDWLKLARTVGLERLKQRRCECVCPDKKTCPYEIQNEIVNKPKTVKIIFDNKQIYNDDLSL